MTFPSFLELSAEPDKVLSPGSVELISSFVPKVSSLVVVSCLSDEAGVIASAFVGGQFGFEDVRLFRPEDGVWRVSDAERLISSSFLRPRSSVNVFVLSAASSMSTLVSDKLLKTVEEPLAPSVFFFVVSDPGLLSATMLSRASDVLDVSLLDDSQLAVSLAEEFSVSVAVAASAVKVSFGDFELSRLLVSNEALLAKASDVFNFSLSAGLDVPVSRARYVFECLSEFAAFVPVKRRPARLRELVGLWISGFQNFYVSRLSFFVEAADVSSVERVLAASAEAVSCLGAYTAPVDCLALPMLACREETLPGFRSAFS